MLGILFAVEVEASTVQVLMDGAVGPISAARWRPPPCTVGEVTCCARLPQPPPFRPPATAAHSCDAFKRVESGLLPWLLGRCGANQAVLSSCFLAG